MSACCTASRCAAFVAGVASRCAVQAPAAAGTRRLEGARCRASAAASRRASFGQRHPGFAVRAKALRMAAGSSATGDGPAEASDASEGGLWNLYVKASVMFTNLFPLWTVLVAVIAVKQPSIFTWLTTPYFTGALAMLMLSMGITLAPADFVRVLKRFGAVGIGFIGCYALMPVLSLALGKGFNLSGDILAGLVLVGAVNGGQASNLCTYIARGNVALSVMMTTATTLGAIVMTPIISKLLIGTVVPVDAVGIAMSTIQVVLAPIAIGMVMNRYANKVVQAVLPFSPVVGVLATCLLVGSSVAQCASDIVAAGAQLQIATALLHVLGGIFGYFLPKIFGYNEIVCRTTAIETAMKSSAFAFLLASLHFGSYAVRVPAAVSVVWMALIGSSLAVMWRYIPVAPTLKFDRTLANRRGVLDIWLKPSKKSKASDYEI
eukprot:CAMPEP_0185831886 /NCGR_PEP_ID=MMETSP1353-20130828/1759_1 /TAXON_ID=1077150 /ORGANISM="Erythrolobus australicus, Strain CCMP3124" /LENGTH=433 /DNA_ID=CAMNT_0028529999 /DNA_START=46 /DNA_END=1347 /DNA_ORIENTATION=+